MISSAALAEVCEFVLDGTHNSPVRVTAGIPVLSAQNVINGTLTYNADRHTTQREYEVFRRRLDIQAGDVLLTIVGTIGRAAVVREKQPAVFQRSVAVLRPKRGVLCERFLFHATQSSDFQRQLAKATNQSSQAGVYLGKLSQTLIPLPSFSEQRRIAAILDKADELRAKRCSGLGHINSLSQVIFLDLFGDPVVNSKGWPITTLGRVGLLDRGVSKHRPRNAPELLGGPYPLVQTGGVANCDGYIRTYSSTYSDIGLRQSKMWPVGTLCITIAANIAKTGILSFDACFPDSIVGFRADDPATVEYVRVWLSFLQKTLEESAPESAQKNINLAILRGLRIPEPPLELQREFARRIAALEKLKAAHRASLAQMNALFASLQHRAFRGEL